MIFKEGQTVICEVDVFRNGDIYEYDGFITNVDVDSVDVCYLQGWNSRNDRIKFESIVALVDETRVCPHYKTNSFSGYLIPNPIFKTSKIESI